MTRAWITDLMVGIAWFLLIYGGVTFLGGPSWAAFGFAWTGYLWSPKTAQFKARTAADIAVAKAEIERMKGVRYR